MWCKFDQNKLFNKNLKSLQNDGKTMEEKTNSEMIANLKGHEVKYEIEQRWEIDTIKNQTWPSKPMGK